MSDHINLSLTQESGASKQEADIQFINELIDECKNELSKYRKDTRSYVHEYFELRRDKINCIRVIAELVKLRRDIETGAATESKSDYCTEIS